MGARSLLLFEWWLVLATAILLQIGCAAPGLTGPNTVRCTGGAHYEVYAPRTTIECGEELVITGTASENGTTIVTGVLSFLAGLAL